ncbi:MAG: tRNA pseudouridine synthase A, partial [Desulfobulbales bacterium]|nr:tRNA pseudouridine synthase A [Desulfobulbales bacterium]
THVFSEPDCAAMEEALDFLTGSHDFSSFEGSGSRDPAGEGRGAVRTIFAANVHKTGKRKYMFVMTGDGFLRHMVRNIVGTVLEVGQGKLAASDVADILAARDRSVAGATAPARGLFLKEVHYD